MAKQRVVANKPTKEIKWNDEKYSVNPKEGRKGGKKE